MKKNLLIKLIRSWFTVGFILLTAPGFAQKSQLIPDSIFTKMIVDDITYAITGENTPVSGFKIDVSKPEGTISAVFPTKNSKVPWDIFSFELKGGVTDKNFSFLKGLNSASSAFEFRPSWHFITLHNSAKFGPKQTNGPKKQILAAQNELVFEQAGRSIDTFYVVTALYNHHLGILNQPKTLPQVTVDIEAQKSIAAYLIPKLIRKSGLVIKTDQSLDAIMAILPPAKNDAKTGLMDPATFNNDVVLLYLKQKKAFDGLPADKVNKVIANASTIWTQKSYLWLTFSPFVKTDKANEYYTLFEGRDSLYFKSGYRWSYGASLTLNQYWVNPGKLGVFLRGALSLSQSNNLANLTAYNYETRNPMFIYGTSVTEKSKTGSAYNNSDIQSAFMKQGTVELYLLPLASSCPGLYLSGNVAQSDLFKLPAIAGRQNDTWKIGAEGGFIFNVNNREKDKTVLSVITYFRYEDFTDSQRTTIKTNKAEPIDDFRQRNMGFGLKVGIPITLPKRS
ncbi:hypothetical protein [Mucilaginibacter sp.]|uniref:hypothetical protein n=1 Tax=Mucilaginibacter sp. TaxID=1882438 RepID=UPI003266F74D